MKQLICCLLIGIAIIVLTSEHVSAQSRRDILLDASLHYVISAEITFASCMYFTLKNPDISLTKKYLAGAGIGIFVGIGKELTDLIKTEGEFDCLDIGFDLLGVGTGLLLHFFIFDRKRMRGKVSLNISETGYTASLKFHF